MVTNGEITEAPSILTYSCAVSKYSAHLAFFLSKLNDFYIMVYDVLNEYFNSPCQEKFCFSEVLNNGPDKPVKVVVMVSYLYGLKSSGVACRKTFI